ncbi:MAG: Holliday junction branch migration protein RuvA [Proteobacteria bacterium]|nr:Holliday junction branch migration protein RuvA [Pseudomonadota bacterium]
MIGYLAGTLLEKKPPHILLDVQGVGYEVEASMQTFYKLPDIHEPVKLFTHLVVREDAQLLYGFFDKTERTLFRHLIKVSGVGPKMAVTILSNSTPEQFVYSIHHDDVMSLVKLPGIGKKTAERLLIEMRDRLKDWDHGVLLNGVGTASESAARKQVTQDAISALVALGYKPQEASRAISLVENDSSTSQQLIRDALRKIAEE